MAKKPVAAAQPAKFQVIAPRTVGVIKFKPGLIYRDVKPEIFEAVKDIAVNVEPE